MVPEEEGGGSEVTNPLTGHVPAKPVYSYGTPGRVLLGIVLALVMFSSPCHAQVGYTYLDNGVQPTLVAHDIGETGYYPGDSFEIVVNLTNRGRETAMQVAPLLKPGVYDPSTALGVMVRPGAGNAPVTIKSLPVMAGDISSWSQAQVTIRGTVHQNASPGVYILPLNVSYRYVYAIPMVDERYTTINLLYRSRVQTIPVTLRVQGNVKAAVSSEKMENMVPGTQGYFTASIINTGYATGNEVTLRIVPSDNTTFMMVDDSVYRAKFVPGEEVPFRVRIAVKEHTAAGSYPGLLEGKYRDINGMFKEIVPVPVGITVLRGAVMEVVARNLTIAPGEQEAITVSFKNTGDTPAYDAMARIIGSQVIIPKDDSVSLGTVGPGESKSARFVISAESAISGKQYVIDSDVKYRDSLGNLMLSDPMSFGIDVTPSSGFDAILSSPVILIIITGVLIILIYAGWRIWERWAKK